MKGPNKGRYPEDKAGLKAKGEASGGRSKP
jgi:hypothetical protein